MKFAIASDHAGFEQKQQLIEALNAEDFEILDLGPDNDDRVDYPDFAEKLSKVVASGDVDFGVLVCGTGIGMAIAANKVDGIRAANVTRSDFAALAREHNDANVLTLSGRFVSLDENLACIRAFATTEFGGGRHAGRVEKIMDLEHKND